MEGFTLWKARARLTRELASWRMAAIGLLALAVLVNVAMMARITHLEDAREADAVRHQEELRQAEQARELAALLPWPVFAGALQGGVWKCLS